jgi:hypothetical protein
MTNKKIINKKEVKIILKQMKRASLETKSEAFQFIAFDGSTKGDSRVKFRKPR